MTRSFRFSRCVVACFFIALVSATSATETQFSPSILAQAPRIISVKTETQAAADTTNKGTKLLVEWSSPSFTQTLSTGRIDGELSTEYTLYAESRSLDASASSRRVVACRTSELRCQYSLSNDVSGSSSEIRFQLLTMTVHFSSNSLTHEALAPASQSLLSEPFRFVIPAPTSTLLPSQSKDHVSPPLKAVAGTEDLLRDSLCNFFADTNGQKWNSNTNWCTSDTTLSVCSWAGFTCMTPMPTTGAVVLGLNLFNNSMGRTGTTPFRADFLQYLPAIQSIDLSTNPQLLPPALLNFTLMPQLTSLNLSYVNADMSLNVYGSKMKRDTSTTRLQFAENDPLTSLDISFSTTLLPDYSSLFHLITLHAKGALTFTFDSIQSLNLQVLMLGRTALVTDNVDKLLKLKELRTLDISYLTYASSITPVLPSALNETLTKLTHLYACCSSYQCLKVQPYITSFANMRLQVLEMHANGLTCAMGPDFLQGCSDIKILTMQDNRFTTFPFNINNTGIEVFQMYSNVVTDLDVPYDFTTDFVDQFSLIWLPNVTYFDFANNGATSENNLPSDFWDRLPQVQYLDLSQNAFTGSIPDPATPKGLATLSLSSNQFTGNIPRNLIASFYDLSYNHLSGPLILRENSNVVALHVCIGYQTRPVDDVNWTGVTMPIDVGSLSSLVYLDFQNVGIKGATFNWNSSWMQIPTQALTYLDISSNDWAPQVLSLAFPTLQTFKATDANVLGFDQLVTMESLTALLIGNNPLQSVDTVMHLLDHTPNVMFFYCQDSGLGGPIATFLTDVIARLLNIIELDAEGNQFTGHLSPSSFLHNSPDSLPVQLRQLNLANNLGITGNLPTAAAGYSELEYADFSNTNIGGPLPESWRSFLNLQRLDLGNTQLACGLTTAMDGTTSCTFPSWVQVADTTTSSSTMMITSSNAGYSCPPLLIFNESITILNLDPAYHFNSLCECQVKFFGANGFCTRCPPTCQCQGNVIQGCFPVVERWTAPNSEFVASIHTTIMECPLTLTGQTLCNMNAIPFHIDLLAPGDPDNPTPHSMLFPPSIESFCYEGHTGRLCSKCQDGYFASGRWCLKCLGSAFHILIICFNCLLFVGIVAYLYTRTPSVADSAIALRVYQEGGFEDSNDDSEASVLSQPVAESIASSEAFMSDNPWKLLVFHGQQLGVLLFTSTSMPTALAGFTSVISSGSGFSLSSVLSVECLDFDWGLAKSCWSALVAPAAVGLFALGIYSYHRFRERQQNRDGGSYFVSDPTSCPSSMQVASNETRWYGVCVSLLYIMVFPCAQVALSAVSCTDQRELHADATTERIFLNLFPYQQCDDDWEHYIMLPGIIGTLLWFVIFPICSTLLLRRLKYQLDCDAALHNWPLMHDLVKPYQSQYWYFEQVFLLRRLALVVCVTLIPSSSLYLPVGLFALIQVFALVQHLTQPYSSRWLNRGELASQYLLLLNYFTALVVKEQALSASSLSDDGQLDIFTRVLFLANVFFVLLLVGLLLTSVRHTIMRIMKWIRRYCCCCFRRRKDRSHSRAHHAHRSASNVDVSISKDYEVASKSNSNDNSMSFGRDGIAMKSMSAPAHLKAMNEPLLEYESRQL